MYISTIKAATAAKKLAEEALVQLHNDTFPDHYGMQELADSVLVLIDAIRAETEPIYDFHFPISAKEA